MLPFRLKPVFKNYIWGGRKLIDSWRKKPEDFNDIIAESWELAAHKDGDNIILDGVCKNMTLSQAIKLYPEIVSQKFKSGDTFPIIVKLIDSREPLSIQVHPGTEYALRVEKSLGKTEAWYILDHEEGAYLYLGFKHNITRSEFERGIIEHTLPELMRKVEVHRGDTFFIPLGTIHAIGAGITLVEIQENSNITYRVYDYGRKGRDGTPRELHIEKALDVTNTFPLNIMPPGKSGNIIVSCNKFHVEKISIKNFYTDNTENKGFKFFLCVSGSAVMKCADNKFTINRGENIFVPSDCENDFIIEGNAEFLITTQKKSSP